MAVVGREQSHETNWKTAKLESGDAQSDARGLGPAILAVDGNSPADPALVRLLAVWADLTDGDQQRLAADAVRLAGLRDDSEATDDSDPDE